MRAPDHQDKKSNNTLLHHMFNTGSSGGAGLFGAPKPSFGASQSSVSQFGQPSSNTANSSGSGFSLGPNANSGALFGSNAAGQSVPGTSSTQATGFGSTATSTFGNSNTTQQGGLFGSAANTGANTGGTTAQSSGGLFGKPSAPSTGLFGASTAQNKPAGLFGSSSATNTPQAPQGGLFGKPAASSATPATSGGLLGAPAALNTSGTLGGLFGSKPAATTGTATGFSFGGNTGTSGGLFGATNTNTAAPAANTGFGGVQNANAGLGAASGAGGLFGGNANNAQPSFAWSTQNAAAPASQSSLQLVKVPAKEQSAATYTPAINDQLAKLKDQWDPNSAKCVLKTHVYNKFSEQEIAVLMQQPRPANETPEDWEKAMAARPGPLYYPVKVSSFSEVAQRIEVQLDHVAKSRILLNSINDAQTQLLAKHDLDNTTRIVRAKVRHTKLARRLLRLATILAILKLKGYPMLPEEEEISKQFQALNGKITDPNGPAGKLSDLYARLAILKGRSEELSTQLESIQSMNGGLNGVTRDTEDPSVHVDLVVAQLTKLLYKQQVGLSYLNEVLVKDLEAVNGAIKP